MSDGVREVFAHELWADRTSEVPGATWCFVSGDIAAAILDAPNTAMIAERWAEVQTALENFSHKLPRSTDCYLLLIVPSLAEDEFATLRPALDDTLVCRKSLIVTEGRSISEAILSEFPIVASTWIATPFMHGQDTVLDDPNEEDLELLDKRGEQKIAEALIDRARATLDGKVTQ